MSVPMGSACPVRRRRRGIGWSAALVPTARRQRSRLSSSSAHMADGRRRRDHAGQSVSCRADGARPEGRPAPLQPPWRSAARTDGRRSSAVWDREPGGGIEGARHSCRGGPCRPRQLLVEANRSHERRAELERHFGPPVERVRGLDRYVTTGVDDVDEVLVDPATALPYGAQHRQGGPFWCRVCS